MDSDVLDLNKSTIIRAIADDGQPCHFKFNKETGEMQKIEPPQPEVLNFLPLHSKICLEHRRMVVAVWDYEKVYYDQLIFDREQGFSPAPVCSCCNCRQLSKFDEDTREGRVPVGYKRQLLDESGEVLIPLEISWNREQTFSQFTVFVDVNGVIGRYQRKNGQLHWKPVEIFEEFRTKAVPRSDGRTDKDLRFQYYEMCPHLNQPMFYCSSVKDNRARQFIFNTHHLQMDEVVCTACMTTSTFRDTFLYKKSGLVTMFSAERIQRTVGVFQSVQGTLEWGIYNREKKKFVQKSEKVVDCTDMTTMDILSRFIAYSQEAKCRLDNFEFICPKAQKKFWTVFAETTPTHTIHWAMDDTGHFRPFELREDKDSPSLGELVMMRKSAVLAARDDGLQVITQKLEKQREEATAEEQQFMINQIISMALCIGKPEDIKGNIFQREEAEKVEKKEISSDFKELLKNSLSPAEYQKVLNGNNAGKKNSEKPITVEEKNELSKKALTSKKPSPNYFYYSTPMRSKKSLLMTKLENQKKEKDQLLDDYDKWFPFFKTDYMSNKKKHICTVSSCAHHADPKKDSKTTEQSGMKAECSNAPPIKVKRQNPIPNPDPEPDLPRSDDEMFDSCDSDSQSTDDSFSDIELIPIKKKNM